MIRRILTAAALIPLVLASIYWFPLPLFLLVLNLLMALSYRECTELLKSHRGQPLRLTYLPLLTAPWVFCYAADFLMAYLIASFILIVSAATVQTRDMETGFITVTGNAFVLGYLGLPFSLLTQFHPNAIASSQLSLGATELVLVLGSIWMGDAAAYFVGRRIGKHKVLPSLSPRKSMEGFVAGILAPAIILPAGGYFLLPGRPVPFLLLAGTAVAVFGILGDLFESMLKRSAGIKDSSSLLPGHGGLLDRIDSLLLAVPAYYLLAILLESPTPAG